MTFTKRKQLQMMDRGFTEESSMVDGFEFGVIGGTTVGREDLPFCPKW